MASIYASRGYVEVGGLLSYGTKIVDNYARAAVYVDKIFKGARPGDLPVEQPVALELVVNLRTARALGITIPRTILMRSDEVIE
jgi:putative ABC transport system substrate-binding protein